jgi:hypothetical protein
VRQFQRPGVVYRPLSPVSRMTAADGRTLSLPTCETSLVWREAAVSPALAQLIRFAKAQ